MPDALHFIGLRVDLEQDGGPPMSVIRRSFAPDGKRIVFRLQKGDKYALATIRRDGRHLRLLGPMTKVMPRYIDWGTHP